MSGAIRNTFTNGHLVYKHFLSPAFVTLLLLSSLQAIPQSPESQHHLLYGAIVRGDTSLQKLALVFTGDEYAGGGTHISSTLAAQNVKASFFFTGKFYRNPDFGTLIQTLLKNGHYLGAHSDQHLLYCDWENRDSLLVTQKQFQKDLEDNYFTMSTFGISREDAPYFLPPYEWYNDSISKWTSQMDLQLLNLSYGTLSHADYTVPGTRGYRSSQEIYQTILNYEVSDPSGLNGFILLVHIGTVSERTDKFYFYLENLLKELKSRGYRFERIDELLCHTLTSKQNDK